MSNHVAAARLVVLLAVLLVPATKLYAVANWGVDLGNSSLSISADVYADSGINGFDPGPNYFDAQSTIVFVPGFIVGPDTFDLGAAVNPLGSDDFLGTSPPTITSASAVGVITINGLGSSTLDINWRANTLNDFIGFEGFLSDSTAHLLASIRATIDGVAPGTQVKIGYDWSFFGTAETDHEAISEDPELAAGHAAFTDDQGTGPAGLFAILLSEPGPTADADADAGSYFLTTSNPNSYLDIGLSADSVITMDAPGTPPMAPLQEDLGGSEFLARLTLTLTEVVPEPSSLALAAVALAALAFGRRRK